MESALKKALASLLVIAMVFSLSISVHAEDGDNAIALVNEETCITLDDVVSKVTSNASSNKESVIKLLQDVYLENNLVIEDGMNVTLDLNGQNVTVSKNESTGRSLYAVDNYGTFTLKDSQGTGSIRARGLENLGNGQMTIESGKIISCDSNGGAAIWNEANLTIKGGEFETEHVGSASDNVGVGCLNNSGNALITGGKFYNVNKRTYAIISTGEIEITPSEGNEVNVHGAHGGLAIDSGIAVVNGGSYSSDDYYGLYVSNDGKGLDPEVAAVTVNGGTFAGKTYSVWIGSDYNNPVNSTIEINGGTFAKALNAQECTREGAIQVSGGIFKVKPDEQYLAPGFSVPTEADENGNYIVHVKEDIVAVVKNKEYSSLEEALDAAQANDTIRLLNNVELNKTLNFDKNNLTLDLNGHTISQGDDFSENFFIRNPKNLTITDNSASKNGKITSASVATIYTTGSLIIESGTIENIQESGAHAVYLTGASSLEANGGTITANANGIRTDANFSGNILFNGGKVCANYGIYADKGTIQVDNGEINGTLCGFYVNNVQLTINDGNVSAVTNDAIRIINSTLTVNDGSLESQGRQSIYATGNNTLTIRGGVFKGTTGGLVVYAENESQFISGGNFSSNPKVDYIADGYYTVVESDDTWSVNSYIAKVGDEYYKTLQNAITVANNNNQKIILLDDVVESVVVYGHQTVTLDLYGHKLTNEAGKHTITVNGTLTVQDSSESKTGMVDNVSHAKAAVYNEVGATTTLNGGTYTRSQENGISSSNNGGNSYYTILNHGTMEFNEGISVNQGLDQAGRYSSMIENGWQNGTQNTTKTPSIMTINGGNFAGGLYTVKNDDYGKLTINGGTFSNSSQATILNWNTTEIKDGVFKSLNNVIVNGYSDNGYNAGDLSISGGSFEAGTNGNIIYKNTDEQGSINISGGTFNKSLEKEYLDNGLTLVPNENGFSVEDKNEDNSNVFATSLDRSQYSEGEAPITNGYVFAGWYSDEDCQTVSTETTGDAYAKFVIEDVLSVKVQLSADTTNESEKTNLRFVTTVDCTDYQSIGFKITINGKTINKSSTQVFEKITASDSNDNFDYSPTIFNQSSKYFATYTITNIPKTSFDTEIEVIPYWITQDGTEVDGVGRTLTVNEGIVNANPYSLD